jgi:hypothetical protein
VGLFDWLFGKKLDLVDTIGLAPVQWCQTHDPQWEPSENGNPCLIYKNRRITVFERDRGWKFCIAKIEDDDDPYFSEVYFDEAAAKYEALARMDGRPSKHLTRSEDYGRARKEKWEDQIVERAKLYEELSDALSIAANVTELRKIQRKIESQAKQATWQISQYYRDGVSQHLITQAEALAGKFDAMAPKIETKIAEMKARPRGNKS